MSKTSLDEHKSYLRIGAVIQEIFEKYGLENIETMKTSLTHNENYYFTIFYSFGSIIDTFNQLYFSIEQIENYLKGYCGEDFTNSDFIRYQIENYYFRFTSVFDRSLRSTNTTFSLGLQKRDCKESTIIKNEHVKHTPVKTTLEALRKLTEKYKQERNTIAHHSCYSDQELEHINSCWHLIKMKDVDGDVPAGLVPYAISKTEEYISEKIELFKKGVEELEFKTSDFFDSIFDYLPSESS